MSSRGSLAQRMAVLAIAASLLTGVVAGGIGVSLIRRGNTSNARAVLARLATVVQAEANQGVSAQAGQARAADTLRAINVQFAAVNRAGVVTGRQLAQDAVTPADVQRILNGSSLSVTRTVDGGKVLIEARPTRNGGLVLVQRQADATAIGDQAVRRLLIALAIAVGIAVCLGLLVAWRLAGPLRRTAAAAHALAQGRRDVVVVPEGPTEVAEVGEALNTLARELAHSEARQREFLLSVSHDLRTPLTAISGYAESLSDGMIAPDRAPHAGAVILGEAQRLNRLVADLLDLARLGSQEFRIDLADVDVVGVVHSAAPVWANRCSAVGVRFGIEVPDTSLVVRTDAARLRQMIDGLFDNALRVTPAGAPIVLAARFEQSGAQRWVAVDVRDGGPGLSDDDLAVAFDRSVLYERYRGVRQVGTGLGLAIVQGLVQRLGGSVEAGHAIEGGARFTLRLPVAG